MASYTLKYSYLKNVSQDVLREDNLLGDVTN